MAHHGGDVCGVGCVRARRNSSTISTIDNLWGRSFLFPPEPLLIKLIKSGRS